MLSLTPIAPHGWSLRRLLRGAALLFAVFFSAMEPRPTAANELVAMAGDDERLLDELQRTAFLYFVEQTHPVTGLVRDRARADGSPSEGKASIAASGFAFDAWVIAVERGWVGRDEALARVRSMVRFLVEEALRQHGFFYHFMEMDTGARAWQCEVSSIDTSLCLAGAIVAREYFQDDELTALVNQLYRGIDWQWFLNEGPTASLGWHDEHGFSRYRWRHFAEHLLMHLLGLGAPERAFDPSSWQAWAREPVGTYSGYTYLQQPPLFVHQYSQAYFDLRDRRDAHADYHWNSVLATLAHRQFCIDLQPEFPKWGEDLWGVSASDSVVGYKAWGGPPRTLEFNRLDGTIVPCAAAGSLPFAPAETLRVLRHVRDTYGAQVWKRYGFVDAFNPHTGWVNSDVLGIDLGISMVQAENLRTGLIWSLFMQAPEAQRAVDRAGLLSTARHAPAGELETVRGLAQQAWANLQVVPATTDTLGLRLSAVVAARALGLVPAGDAAVQARVMLESVPPPVAQAPRAETQFAAALLTLRQAFPELAAEADVFFGGTVWTLADEVPAAMGSAERLRAFLHVAMQPEDVTPWTRLNRSTEKVGDVHVLAPADVEEQMWPGLWLDEQDIVSGASASQLAYAQLRDTGGPDGATAPPPDLRTAALWLEHFPRELAARLEALPDPAAWLQAASAEDQAAWLVTAANVLTDEGVRAQFQREPRVIAARAAIPEFGAEAFGARTSLIRQYELAGPAITPVERRTVAARAGTPRERWAWNVVSGLDFHDSVADVRPEDPPLEMRFAFTWDEQHLHFHAEVTDSAKDRPLPAEARRRVELFIDTGGDGLVWQGSGDHQFLFPFRGEPVRESFHGGEVRARMRGRRHGYTLNTSIPWSQLGLQPTAGMDVRVAPAVVAEGNREWLPALKLTWRYAPRSDGKADLGWLRLE